MRQTTRDYQLLACQQKEASSVGCFSSKSMLRSASPRRCRGGNQKDQDHLSHFKITSEVCSSPGQNRSPTNCSVLPLAKSSLVTSAVLKPRSPVCHVWSDVSYLISMFSFLFQEWMCVISNWGNIFKSTLSYRKQSVNSSCCFIIVNKTSSGAQ